VKLGRVSLFELPRLLLDLLGLEQAAELDAFVPPEGLHPRFRDGRLLSVPEQGAPRICTPAFQGEDCRRLQAWYADMPLLRADILTDSDYTTAALYGDPAQALALPPAGESYLSTDSPSRACDIRVTGWGLRTTRLGRDFNPKRDGSPSFDLAYTGSARQVQVWLGFEKLEVYATDSHEHLSLGGSARTAVVVLARRPSAHIELQRRSAAHRDRAVPRRVIMRRHAPQVRTIHGKPSDDAPQQLLAAHLVQGHG
jgi:hypothetical protein